MLPGGRGDPRSGDHRRWRRVRLSLPAQLGKSLKGIKRKGGGLSPHTGETRDLSPGGAYVTVNGVNPFARGELLKLSIAIPWESRHVFPFSRITGSSRVVRVEELPISDEGRQTGVALEFCDDVTVLGTIMTP